ncbi:Outer membrane protein assembly factor BamB precursor [Roseovarius litorisediminis]|uniref:Outer membrane protein assembly factor BamB n=1 Tax=Roseovarius litorisediminis TaxID=1312363 RepID=A0A1Y5SB95_9RHOB|nr:Outer membrane protein assembly factor BamB precursor [Roseovarius litorisediminis]
MGARVLKTNGLILGLAAILSLTACTKKEAILTGERENIRDVLTNADGAAIQLESQGNLNLPLSLTAAQANTDWVQRAGSPTTRNAHPALGSNPQLVWSVNIGAGDGRKNRITADPVVAGGRVFTLDAQAKVTAVSTSGKVLWSRDLTPPNDSGPDAGGGGLAYGDGKLFVSSGFGLMTALDPATGGEIWQQNLRSTGTGSPTVMDDLVYLVSGDEIAWALDTGNGRIRWQLSATPDINNVMGGPAPAVTDKYAVFAFGSGELQGAFRKGGLRLWDTQVAGQRPGIASAKVGDITGDPVVDGDKIYVGSHSGRTVALGLGNGKRLWTANEGPLNPVWPAGDSIFMVSDRNELLRLSAEDGTRIWGQELPLFTKDRPRRQTEIFGHYGPIIAGGRLIVASSDGQLRFFDPASGAAKGTLPLPGGATTNPVVAGNTLYVVSTKGQLHAFR